MTIITDVSGFSLYYKSYVRYKFSRSFADENDCALLSLPIDELHSVNI